MCRSPPSRVVAAYAAVPEARDTDTSERAGLAGRVDGQWRPGRRHLGVDRGRSPRVDGSSGVATLAAGRDRSAPAFVWHVPPGPLSARSTRAVSQPNLHRRECGDDASVCRYRRDVLPRHLRASGRFRLVPAQGGTALLPVTVLMLLLSEWSGALGQRIGPRSQLTVGPLLTGAGLLLLARLGPHTSYVVDVLAGGVSVRSGTRDIRSASDGDGDGSCRPRSRQRGVERQLVP